MPAWLEQAWQGKLSLLELTSAAEGLVRAGHPVAAVALYRAWLRVPRTSHDHLAWFNLGALLAQLDDPAGARDAYLSAIARAPGFLQARFNLGLVYERLGHSDAAIGQWRTVARLASAADPDGRALKLLALNNLGRHLEDLKRYAEASAALTESLLIEPDQPDVIHHWIFERAKQCLWPVHEPLPGLDVDKLWAHTSALAMIAMTDDPQAQLAAAQRYVRDKLGGGIRPALAQPRAHGHRRIRIGYCSSDFRQHPVAMLTAELFELHDRSAFELYAFDWTPEDASPLRQRIKRAFDHFIRIDGLDDEAAARLIRSHEIDVLVDLHGQTMGARPGIFTWRPAPIQITYLGLPATTGFPFIDYVIADRFLIPPEMAPFYTEKPLYMPGVYQVSDRRRTVGPTPSRQACGLPEQAFVFCCMNNNYKITPAMFDVWMRILQQVPASVLWLLADNEQAPENLVREAVARGVDPARLIFAPRTSPADYLARYALADLFLDTFPFNAGTTANDALWMGLPVLTLSGRTFASRMAGALLTAAGVPELITFDAATYERRAIELANRPDELAGLRARLAEAREASPLFDIPGWVQAYEARLKELVAQLPA
ncbi:acetylglucosamine transferase [Tepidimonas sediminis]|uniref:O-linked N-acetylglucosamine transferase, SPINDLY family protein n=1 Tax=Tepidimonas sediminis TaxID=2588941 RepID=UPI001FEBF963|nr:acetylglucosamine transferase [Tepidimonas sediminis]